MPGTQPAHATVTVAAYRRSGLLYGYPALCPQGSGMVAIVNGYTCFTTCDAAAARQGRDPHKPVGSPPDGPGNPKSAFDQHASVLGGGLQDLMTDTSDPADRPPPARPSVDILV